MSPCSRRDHFRFRFLVLTLVCCWVSTLPIGASGEVGTVRDTAYDRRLYGSWADLDSDCLDTRHEILRELATGPVTMSPDGCRVVRGRWNDPYTGRIHREARELDIDHLVPLAWAHARGGHRWSATKRRQFANDPVNLFAVQASVNRSKGAAGPLEWLPPDPRHHCAYVTRSLEPVVHLGTPPETLRDVILEAQTSPEIRPEPARATRPGGLVHSPAAD